MHGNCQVLLSYLVRLSLTAMGKKWLPKCGKSDGCEASNGSNSFLFPQSIFNVFKWFIIYIFFSGEMKDKDGFT